MTGPNESYAAAYRLLSQLRVISRELSGGLEATSLAESLLQSLAPVLAFDRGALFVRSAGGVITPLAAMAAQPRGWPEAPEIAALFSDVWTSQAPAQRRSTSGEPERWTAALPLRTGARTFGIIGIQSYAARFRTAALAAAMQVVDEAAIRLDTALLFAEVRTLATAEERRRLAHEIHDGIAQELTSLGYVVDDLAERSATLPDVSADLVALRGELSRMINELRLSIFDLRSETGPALGLGDALSDYVRQVGAASGLTVHLILGESPTRLPADTEAELLRIAQEAITNARKHARATTLWVTCQVSPPVALLRVEDDGVGLGEPRPDSFGVAIMRERAARLGARLVIRNREHGGALVEVRVS